MTDKIKIGLIGIVGTEAKADFWGTMERVAKIGYRGIEAPEQLLEGDAAENVKRFHDLGLEVLTVSGSQDSLRTNLDGVIAKAKALHSPRVSVWWAPCVAKDVVLQDAALFNAAGEALSREGITLCYHHHEQEFRNTFNGVAAFDLLLEYTDPAYVSFYVDIAWAAFGGADPAALVRRLKGRVPAIHVKDLYGLEKRGEFTAVGTGVVDVTGSVNAAIETGVEWAVVEQDTLRNLDAFETITLSYLYLKEQGLI